MNTGQAFVSGSRTKNGSSSEEREKQIIEIIPLRGGLAQLLGSESAAFYERAGLCCDD